MKPISIFKDKPKKMRAVWSDGYITNIIWDGAKYRLEGKIRAFDTLSDLANYYKGTISTISEIKK